MTGKERASHSLAGPCIHICPCIWYSTERGAGTTPTLCSGGTCLQCRWKLLSRQKTDVIWVVGRASPNEVIIHDVMARVGVKRRFFLMAESFGLKSERKVEVVEMWIVCMYEDPPLS